jgi:LysM repeat protein
MKGRVGPGITMCLLVTTAALLLTNVGCQRAKPARVVTPPPATPRVETPVIAQIARATGQAYPAPAEPTATPLGGVDAQAAYPSTALPPTPVTPESTQVISHPTELPTATPLALSTEGPTAAPTAVTTPAGVAPTPEGTRVAPEVIYQVKGGDSLGSIAVLYNTTTAAIMARNGLSDPSLIRVGQELIIPVASAETIPEGSTVQHTVGAGETLDDIARRYRTTAAAVLAQNPALSDPERLAEGTVLTVIVGSEATGRTHVVRPGESLGLIAERYGLTTQELARANGLTDPSRIRVGQTLIIP